LWGELESESEEEDSSEEEEEDETAKDEEEAQATAVSGKISKQFHSKCISKTLCNLL